MDRRDGQHDRNIPGHIGRKLRGCLLHFFKVHALRDHLRHPDLLVDPLHQHLFIDRLVIPAQIIVIKVNVHIVDALCKRKGLIGKQIVHIKRMLRKLHARRPKDIRAEHERMHDQILGRPEPPDVIPSAHFVRREYITVIHAPLPPLIQMVVHIVAHEKIRNAFPEFRASSAAQFPDAPEQHPVCTGVQPVVRIHHFVIEPAGQLQPFIHPGSVTAVLLVHRAYNVRVSQLVFICDLASVVGRTVVDQDDLHITPAGKQRIHTSSHVIL